MMSTIRCCLSLLLLSALPLFAQQPLTLAQAVDLALARNPALRQSAGQVETARATADLARAGEKLQVGASARYTHLGEVNSVTLGTNTIQLGTPDSITAALTAQKVIYSGGRLSNTVRQAESGARAQEVSGERTRQVVAYQAESAFLTLLTAQRQAEVAHQAQVTAEEQLGIARARFDAGTAARFDVLRAEVQAEEARQNVIQAQSNIDTAHAALLRALGVENGQYVATDAGLPEPVAPNAVDTYLTQALAQRPELHALDWQIHGAEAAILAARGEKSPTISLQAGYQLVTPTSVFTTSGWSAGAAVSLPVLDGGAITAQVRQASGVRNQLLAARDAQRDQVAAEVRQAYARLIAATSAVEVAHTRQTQAEELYRVARVRYDAGVGTAVEIADAQTLLTSARQGVARALNDWNLATADLQLAAGTYSLAAGNEK